jgi:hypothetical protein
VDLYGFNEDVFFGDWQPIFDEAINVQLDVLADIPVTFFDGFALRVATRQGGTEDVVATFILFFKNYRESVHHSTHLKWYSTAELAAFVT